MPKPKTFNCPLCRSILPEKKYYEIVGAWEAKANAEKEIQKELKDLQLQKKELQEKQKELIRRSARDKKIAIEEGVKKGIKKEEARAKMLASRADSYLSQIQDQNRKIKELQLQLRKGTTPQIEGINLEHELVKQLKKEFLSDKIEHHGQAGDILQIVIARSKTIGSILYECKKTAAFNKDYIHQTKKAQSIRNATYGVLITVASKKNTQGFYVENGIIVVHPYGTVHVAQFLRNSIVEMHSLKLGHKELKNRAQDLMNFVSGDIFRNSVENTIYRTRELAELLKKEMKTHNKIWRDRFLHYNEIHGNANRLGVATSNILKGIPANTGLSKGELKQLPAPVIGKR